MTTYFELLLSTLKYLRPPGESWKTPYTSVSIVAIFCPSISFCGALNQNYSCLFAHWFPPRRMSCQNTISPRDNKWNWECWYGGLKIDNLRCWFFGPPSSNQCLLFQFYSIPTPCWMSLWDWNYPITPKTAASCHWERTTQCKKRYKEFGSWKYHTYINATEYIFALENTRKQINTHTQINTFPHMQTHKHT